MKEHELIILEKIKTYAEQAVNFKGDMDFVSFSKDMRNRIVHDYEGLQLNIVWDVLVDFLPELIESINKLISNS